MWHTKLFQLTVLTALSVGWSPAALTQTAVRNGVSQFALMTDMSQGGTVLSTGVLADLQNDPNFQGEFPLVYNVATDILSGYTIVNRGGYFPENAGIPREVQLTTAEVVYHVFSMQNGNELFLYRSPLENTSRYFIRPVVRE
jgi:hypothetical protein